MRERYMKRALELARRGEGRVSPNPMVGCVAVKDGRIIAEGYHEQYGGYHAERNALLHCTENPEGAELYVNLEPCCHHGKTPPCTDIILEKKIGKVYVGCLDSNPKVAGKGIAILREHGVQVETGILEEECRKLNEIFFHNMETGLPFVAMKYAMTLDGKIACESGDSRWVTGEEARNHVHKLRNRYRGIMAGIGTVRLDDPLLNCRMEGGRNPVRIICDTRLRIPLGSRIVQTAGEIGTILAWNPGEAKRYHEALYAEKEEERYDKALYAGKEHVPGEDTAGKEPGSLEAKKNFLREKGVTLLEIPLQSKAGRMLPHFPQAEGGETPGLDLRQLMEELARRRIDSILLEGGGTLNASMLRENLVQRVYAFIAPKLVAGANAKSPVEGVGIMRMKDAAELQDMEMASFGKDFCITGRVSADGQLRLHCLTTCR